MGERGRLIAFEGIEGAGKSTHLHLAAATLRAQGVAVVETREPGGTPLGTELRRLLMHQPQAPAPWAELLLYLRTVRNTWPRSLNRRWRAARWC